MANTNPRPVTIVTDSTADLGPSLAESLGITVVPLSIAFGTETFQDGIDLTSQEFLDRLEHAPALPKTSQPPVTAFERVFAEALANDRDVVCITISSELSGTYNSARLAAEAVDPARVHVVDSRATTMQQGWVVVAAARLAQAGATADEVAAGAVAAIARTRLFVVLKTLDYVYKGGRIGRARQLAGSALAIKPVITFVDGVVTPLERVRTWKRALARATELAIELPGPTDIAILQCGNPDDGDATAAALRQAFPAANVSIHFVGPVILTYAGPGAIGIAALLPE